MDYQKDTPSKNDACAGKHRQAILRHDVRMWIGAQDAVGRGKGKTIQFESAPLAVCAISTLQKLAPKRRTITAVARHRDAKLLSSDI